MNKKEVKHFFDHLEVFVDKMIPPLVILILGVIIIEFFFEEIAHDYQTLISWVNRIIVSFFVVDLIFKYIHTKNIPNFLKRFWLDILAVFPFFLLFKAFEGIAATLHVAAAAEKGQEILHETLEIQKEGSKLLQEAEKVIKIRNSTRFGNFSRFFKPLSKLPRILKIMPYQARKRVKTHHIKKFYGRVKKVDIKKNSNLL